MNVTFNLVDKATKQHCCSLYLGFVVFTKMLTSPVNMPLASIFHIW